MNEKDDGKEEGTSAAQDLRWRAEQKVRGTVPEDGAPLTLEKAEQWLHELRVYQIELEMQNDELLQAQLALDGSRARYVDLYELAPVGYVTLDEAGQFLETNLRADKLLGFPRSALIHQPVTRFLVEEDQDLFYLHRKKLFETGEPQVCELRLKQADGNRVWVRLEAVLATNEETAALVCRVVMSDITNDRRLRAQLALADRLSSVSLLAASLGHEINNPLTYVLYNLETLEEALPQVAERLTPPDQRTAGSEGDFSWEGMLAGVRIELREMSQLARFAVEGAQRIRDLVKGLRAFANVDENVRERLPINSVLEATLAMAAREISTRARLVKSLGPVPLVSANYGQMSQVFLNLLINAAHSIEEGHVDDNQISIRTWSQGGAVLVEISDTGAGIPNRDLDKIFDPFFTTKPAGSGAGLGLSICTKIVSALSGTLSVESQVGMGSKFTVRLPAIVPVEDGERIPVAPDNADATGADPRGRILLIDDDHLVRETVVAMLRHHELVIATSGIEGRNLLIEDSNFDVILCDLMMPDLSGMDLFAWLKEQNSAAAERVVFITGGAFTPKAQEFLREVDPPRLEKPFKAAHLRAKVATLIREARRDHQEP